MTTFRSLAARAIDHALEATVVGSFTAAGYNVRSALQDWSDPPSMPGQHVVVTGGTSGIGRATAERLLELGATVHLTSRSLDRATEVAHELTERFPAAEVTPWKLDTGDFDSICAFTDGLAATTPQLDVLIHNAGALSADYQQDNRGTELTLSTHLIGPYLLTTRLRPHLASGARVLWMSSGGMYLQKLEVENLELAEEDYQGSVAYARAKRAQVELVHRLGQTWAPEVVMHAMHPGWVDTAGVDSALPGFSKIMKPTLRSAEEGADTMVWLAATGGRKDTNGSAPTGRFWLDRTERRTSYLPRTSCTDDERQALVDWLDMQILPATVLTGGVE